MDQEKHLVAEVVVSRYRATVRLQDPHAQALHERREDYWESSVMDEDSWTSGGGTDPRSGHWSS